MNKIFIILISLFSISVFAESLILQENLDFYLEELDSETSSRSCTSAGAINGILLATQNGELEISSEQRVKYMTILEDCTKYPIK